MSKPIAAVVILVVVIVDLLLIRSVRSDLDRDPVEGTAVPAVAATSDAPAADPAAVTVSLADDGTVVWADRGSCAAGTARSITVTSLDGDDPTAVEPGVTEVLRIEAVDAETIYVEGTADDCGAVVERLTDDGGATWRDTTGAIEWWHPSPVAATTVLTAGPSEPGCTVLALAQADDSGAVACTDGRVRSTDDGTSWSDAGRLDGIRALGLASTDAGGAIAADAECASRYFGTGDGGATWEPAGCIAGEGPAAIAVRGDDVVAVVAGLLAISDDAGATWS